MGVTTTSTKPMIILDNILLGATVSLDRSQNHP